MKRLETYWKHLTKKQKWWGAAAVAALLLGWFIFFRPSEQKLQTVVVEPKAFEQQVSVSGTVIAAQEVDLGFNQGGRVSRVYVSVGRQVGQGTLLAEVENGDLRANVSQQQASLEREEAKLATLKAGTRQEELAVKQAAVDADKADLVDAIQDAYRAADAAVHTSADQLFDNPRYNPSLKASISDTTIKYRTESGRAGAESTLATWGAESAALTVSSDLSVATSHAQSNLATVATFLADAAAALSRAIPTTQVPQATIDTQASAIAAARTSVNAAVSAVNGASASLSTSQKNLTLAQAGSSSGDIAAQEASVKAAAAAVASAQAQLAKTLIRAPFSGTVTVVNAKQGALASTNDAQISMISSGTFQIEAFVPEVNIALLHVGDTAKVTLDAYDQETFEAGVVSIDPASTEHEGIATYRVVLQFSAIDPRIRSGMTASLGITTNKKENALVVPQSTLIVDGTQTFVELKSGKSLERRAVEVGLRSLGVVEIASGLAAGDVVVLNPSR